MAKLNEIKHLLEELKAFAIKHLSELHDAPLDGIDDDEPIGPRTPIDYRALDLESLKEKWDEACEVLHQIETGQRKDYKDHLTDYYLGEVDQMADIVKERLSPGEFKALRPAPAYYRVKQEDLIKYPFSDEPRDAS